MAYNPGKLALGAGALFTAVYYNWVQESGDQSKQLEYVRQQLESPKVY